MAGDGVLDPDEDVDSDEDVEIGRRLWRRRRTVADAWNLTDEVVLVGAGEPIPIPGAGDQAYPFRAHPEYVYLTDRDCPGGVLAFDPHDGWTDFAAPITDAERLWSGAPASDPPPPTTAALGEWLAQRCSRPVALLGATPGDLDGTGDAAVDQAAGLGLTDELRFALSDVRRVKDPLELARMRAAQRATRAGFAAVIPWLRDGISERAAQIELEAAMFRAGADRIAYDTVIGGGPNSAVLHFAPSARRLAAGELVLIDAGAEHRGYASDITRTYPVGGRFDALQQELYDVVHAAERVAIGCCVAGVEWRDVHRAAALVIAEGLVACGILRGRPESLVQSGAVWLFFCHGIGHLVGLGIRDAGGALAQRRDDPPPYPNLRIDLPLRPGMVVTIEPGIYFVPALLGDLERRRAHRDEVDWDRADALLGFGGIRIEDDVLIGAGGREVITADVPLL